MDSTQTKLLVEFLLYRLYTKLTCYYVRDDNEAIRNNKRKLPCISKSSKSYTFKKGHGIYVVIDKNHLLTFLA